MSSLGRRLVIVAAGFGTLLLTVWHGVSDVHAALNYRPVIVEGDPFPGGGTFGVVSGFGLDGDVVYFSGRQMPSSGQFGLYSVPIGGAASLVADQTTPQPGGSGNFFSVSSPIGHPPGSGVIFSGANQAGTERGIYQFDAGSNTISGVVDHTTNVPETSDLFTSFGEAFQDGARTYFNANGSGGQDGFYVAEGGTVNKIFDRSTPVPAPWNATFSSLTEMSVEDVAGDTILLLGDADDYRAYFTTNDDGQSLELVVDANTPMPGYEAFNFDSLFSNGKTNGADVLFYGRSARDPNNNNFRTEGIYGLIDGSLQVVADLNTTNPRGGAIGDGGGFGSFNGVGDFVGDQFAFYAEHDGDADGDEDGIYLGQIDGPLQLLVEEAQPIGSLVTEDLRSVSIDGNRVAFGILSSSNQDAIFVTTVPEPGSVLLLATGATAVLIAGRRRRLAEESV